MIINIIIDGATYASRGPKGLRSSLFRGLEGRRRLTDINMFLVVCPNRRYYCVNEINGNGVGGKGSDDVEALCPSLREAEKETRKGGGGRSHRHMCSEKFEAQMRQSG